MNIRTVIIWTTGVILAAIFVYSFFHCLAFARADAPFFRLPVAMLCLTALVGWPLVVNLVILQFVRSRVSEATLLLSAVLYGVPMLYLLISIYCGDIRNVPGLIYLLIPIIWSFYVFVVCGITLAGFKIYFWITRPRQ